MQVNVIYVLKRENDIICNIKFYKYMLLNLKNLQNMQTCTEKVSLFGVIKSWNEYLQSLWSVTILYKNMHLHGNAGSSNLNLFSKQ